MDPTPTDDGGRPRGSGTDRSFEERAEEYWDWFSVALFLLITVDLLTTMGAVAEYGIGAEANPAMRRLLRRGPVVAVVVHLGVLVIATCSFSGVVEAVRRTSSPYDRSLELAVQVWLGALIATGLAVFANNLAVIVLGGSLL